MVSSKLQLRDLEKRSKMILLFTLAECVEKHLNVKGDIKICSTGSIKAEALSLI